MNIYKFASIMGCPIESRNASNSWVFDGKTIASYYDWNGNGNFTDYSDHDFLHEVLHYVVAEECQRDLPEYGLKIGITSSQSYGPKGGEFRDRNGTIRLSFYANDMMDGLVDKDEQDAQEVACWILAIKLGPLFGYSPRMSDEKPPGITDTWAKYRMAKRQQSMLINEAILKRARVLALKGIREIRKKIREASIEEASRPKFDRRLENFQNMERHQMQGSLRNNYL